MNAFIMTSSDWANCPFPLFFGDNPKTLCKVYHDGGHYVAVPEKKEEKQPHRPRKNPTEAQEVFDSLYAYTLTAGMKRAETLDFLRDNLCHFFPDDMTLDDFIAGEMKRKAHNLEARKKRFRRKAHLNRWTHFITITYADEKHDEETFRRKLRKCLCNLHTRYGWLYMGVFERAPETGRLHFHALLYVPEGEMLGEIAEKKDYSTKQHKMQITHENSFFADKFGRNDFASISPAEMKHGNTLSYLLKYIGKTGERITYSRGIPTEIYREIDQNDVAAEMRDFVLKFVLFDDVIDWESDIMHFHKEQMTFADIPPRYLC